MLDGLLQSIGGQQRTIVMTSHDLSHAEKLATRFDILSQGRIATTASRRDLKKKQLTAFYNETLVGQD